MSTTNGTVSNEALLASVRFGLPRQSRGDKDEARNVETRNSAKKGVTTVSKFYFREMDAAGNKIDGLDELKSFQNAWRAEHNRLTRIWDGGATRMLVAVLAPRYMDMTAKFEGEYPEVTERFVTAAPEWRESAPERMGNLYNASDFPSMEEIRNSITHSKSILPIPPKEQWKKITSITPNLAAQMESEASERMVAGLEEMRLETWNDMIQPLQRLVKVLSNDKTRIFNTLITSLNDMLDLAPAFNTIIGDSQLNLLVATTKQTLAGITADDLRESPELRKVTCSAAKTLLGRFGQASGRKFAA